MMMVLFLLACSNQPTSSEKPAPEKPAPEKPAEQVPVAPQAGQTAFGKPVEDAQAMSCDALVQEADQWSGKSVTVKGTIREVCQKKGCWHTLSTNDPNVTILVKDKEYELFLPKDVAGRQVVVGGTFSVGVMPLEEAQHLAADAGKDPASITVAPKTYMMDADGIKLL